ncbi:HAD-IA family hydrolase [Rhodoferax sp.]|jgi:phosphoglycolate phosphatase|uniref:HAD-IA family hydrolase n=1 Tax=Rhodoferax sp. TaxID=50421 RepID=UPI00272392DF|nr:HAD-IA family hydrolase [Rhodoferax sp.]MDO9143823.1 HAD-IA family hydrolase [Rhodoferax sp.]MDP1531069.1 HAD-IA family hydrolase [Rhodoferax sp.]MDP1945086.1 HAD-IA family hydrolase [Rhodoferax sp.]MDP2442310.1 HAD-IA family hydrolase [Rhodoferax sp.]MDP3190904.1 HAD-IA family hydrolase [Rhodoferax sp.]
MTNRPYDLMLFDLDGTLVETAPEIMDAVNDTLGHFKLSLVTQQQVNDWIGHGTLTLLVQAVADRSGMTVEAVRASELLQTMVPVYDGFYQQRCGSRSHLYPQVRETLHSLRAQGVKLAVVTNKESRYTRVVLDAHQLWPLFDEVVSGDSFVTKKPDPVGVVHCLEKFGVARERTLFVGDSSIDAATARNAGVAVWLLPYGYNMGQPIEACAPDRVIADFSFLPASGPL